MSVAYLEEKARNKKVITKLILQKTEGKPCLSWESAIYFNVEDLLVELGEIEVIYGYYYYYKWKDALKKDIDKISEKADIDSIATHIWNTTCNVKYKNGKTKEKVFNKYVRKYFPLWYRIYTSNFLIFLAIYGTMFILLEAPMSLYEKNAGYFAISIFAYYVLSMNEKWIAPIVSLILNIIISAAILIFSSESYYYINLNNFFQITLYSLIPLIFIPSIVFAKEKYIGDCNWK